MVSNELVSPSVRITGNVSNILVRRRGIDGWE